MKIIATSLLVFAILLITFSKSIIALQYEMNKSYIAAVLCENRDKPMTHCNGSCHLKKTMNNDDQKQNAPAGAAKDGLEIQLFSVHADAMFFDETFSKNISGKYIVAAFAEPSFSIFHPPGC